MVEVANGQFVGQSLRDLSANRGTEVGINGDRAFLELAIDSGVES